jgi:hypothetical protein
MFLTSFREQKINITIFDANPSYIIVINIFPVLSISHCINLTRVENRVVTRGECGGGAVTSFSKLYLERATKRNSKVNSVPLLLC